MSSVQEDRLRPQYSAAAGVGPAGWVFSGVGPGPELACPVYSGGRAGQVQGSAASASGGGVADQLPSVCRVSGISDQGGQSSNAVMAAGTNSACIALPALHEQHQQGVGLSNGIVVGCKQGSHMCRHRWQQQRHALWMWRGWQAWNGTTASGL